MNNNNTYDAIVIGSGISGGWAAKELCEKGLKTLVLERGRMVKHIEDYPTAFKEPWDFPLLGNISAEERKRHHVQSRAGFIREDNKHFFVDDLKHPYEEQEPFDWIRGYHTGGRSIMWGKHCYRWSDLDFEANAKEGIAVDWPIRYKDIAPWYSYVEKYAGISGERLGLPHLPDGEFLPAMPLNCVEEHVKSKVESTWNNRYITSGRVAHVTVEHNGRGPCQYRNRCDRGCPYGAYFSSVSVTLPAAAKTGNMTLVPNAIVHSIIYDEKLGKATGVRVIDMETKESTEYFAKVIFSCASTLGTTQILLNSTSNRFPNGLGNDSGQLGRNLMDHHYAAGAAADVEGFDDKFYEGRRPNGIYIPRFRNIDESTKRTDYLRGYGYQGSANRASWSAGVRSDEFGADFKESLFKPGPWRMSILGFGECLPYEDNTVELSKDKTDEWGIPILSIKATFKENELAMAKDIAVAAAEMLDAAGLKNVSTWNRMHAVGKCIHEMGTARMGRDPKTSVLNGNNQMHSVPNVFVTDGACMTSSANQNPSITYMALTARAVDYAVKELNKQNI